MIIFEKTGKESIAIRVTDLGNRFLLTMHDMEAGETFPTKYMFDNMENALRHADHFFAALCVSPEVSHG